MDLLNGDGAAFFGELFADEYAAGELRNKQASYDELGRITLPAGAPLECRVQIDAATERMRRADGYTATDQAVYILARPGGELPTLDAITSDYELTVTSGPRAGTKFSLATPIDRDPMGAYWLCRGVV